MLRFVSPDSQGALFLCSSGSAVGLSELMTGTLIFTSIAQIPMQAESAVGCRSLAALKTLP